MRGFRWIALQGSSRGLFSPALLLFCFITTSGILPAHAADDPTACRTPVARIVSVQGTIELLRARENDWSKVTRLDTSLCEGDRLRTGALSRAALFIQPETLVRIDQNTRITVSQSAEETLVEFTQEELLPAASGAYSCGAGYFITRFPRKFRVNTPHLNAAVEGTEFLVAMRCEATELSVFEGKVLAAGAGANVFPAQTISSGQVLTIGGSEPPTIKFLVKPADAVQWVVYYPPLSDTTAEADLPSAEQCRSLPKPLDQTCLTQRAEVLLRLGRVDEAQREVDEAVALDPGGGDANALRAIISIARNDKASAIEAATAATTASPNSTRAWLALSYAQQARFKLEDSLSSARKAQALEPNSSVTNARVAELLMSLGRIKDAEVAARAAVDANPSESRAHTVLGFVRLAQIKTKAARADFETAIEKDSSDPLPRLGLGLAIIRTGKLAEGREQLEIAVALDPTNSLLRSYVGKAYYEENSKERDKLAATQFDLAKQLDSKDPTPWFYEAILKQAQNRPIEALKYMQESIGLNDNRAVYRSRLLLDTDLAARDADLARLYKELGFDGLALAEAFKSLDHDSANHSAHRLLAESYATLPRHEIASVSELIQSQLLQPSGALSVPPRLAETDLVTLRGQGPAEPSFNEYTPLFQRSGVNLQLNAASGSNQTFTDELLLAAGSGRVQASIGQSHFETEGFRKNNDYEDTIYALSGQLTAAYHTVLYIEGRTRRTAHGDITSRFDPTAFFPGDRREVDSDTGRIGIRYSPTPSTDMVLTVAGRQRREFQHVELLIDPSLPPIGRIDLNRDDEATLTEALLLTKNRLSEITVGASYISDHVDNAETFEIFGFPPPTITFTQFSIQQRSSYVYVHSTFIPRVAWTIGLSADDYESSDVSRSELNPKFGIVLEPVDGTTLRLAMLRTLKRVLVADQTVEPTQVAGFNQFFDDLNGTLARRQGIALDQRIGQVAYAGMELTRRELTVPFGSPAQDEERDEKLNRAYFYWPLLRHLSLGVEAERSVFERESVPLDTSIPKQLDTRSGTLNMHWYSHERFYAKLRATHLHQEIFLPVIPGVSTQMQEESFWNVNLAAGYKLPRRRGTLSLVVNNLLDETFRYQDLNFVSSEPRLPNYLPERTIFGRVSLVF